MKGSKQQSAELLFDAMGQIDERMIQESMSPYLRRKAPVMWRRVLILAASLTLAAVLLLSAAVIGMMQTGKKGSEPDAADPVPQSLSDRLCAPEVSEKISLCSLDEIDLLDRSDRVIWKYRNESGYRVLNLSTSARRSLEDCLSLPGQKRVPGSESEPEELEGIWICRGDGTVISPCLSPSAGNTFYGTLFDYSPELEPSSQFTDMLYRQIEKAGT